MPAVVPSPDQLPIFEELAAPPPRRRPSHLRIQPPLLADLTPRQRKAVTHGEGPLLIVAGAGTGKTTVITRRIAWLIAEKRARPSEILALTFTDRAAMEMTERVDRLVPYGYTDTVISTFHAFGDRILRHHALEARLSDRSTVLSRAEQVIFLREHLFDLPLDRYRPLGDPTRFLHALVTLISRARDEDVTPADYRAAADALAARAAAEREDAALAEQAAQQRELAGLYQAYESLMRSRDRLDFGDQVTLSLRLLRDHPAVLDEERRRFRYILVDEFQDTNHAQFELVKLLAGSPRANVTVVGDDDQSIYRFRGAALSNILGFRAAFPRAARVVLNDNFRSRQTILDAAHRLIRHNDPERLEAREGLDKRLAARATFTRTTPQAGPIEMLAFDTGSDEADAVAARITSAVRAGRRAGDHAILVRANRDADPFLRALNMAGVPWRFSGTAGLYRQPEVRVLVSFLRAVNDPTDSVSCYDLATSEIFGLAAQDVTRAMNASSRRRISLEAALRQVVERGDDAAFGRRALDAVRALLASLDQHRSMSAERTTGELLYHFVSASGWLARLAREARHSGEERLGNVARFFEIVRRQSSLLRDDRLPFLVEQLDTLIEVGDDPSTADVELDEGDAVHVLTYHKAKGLEFPVVFMVGLVDDRFPTRSRGDQLPLPEELVREPLPAGDHHLAEERRLFYVGMTRAREELVLTWARDYGGRVARRMSPFLLEALDLPPATPVEVLRPSIAERLARHDRGQAPATAAAAAPAALGERPLHLSYGQVSDYLDCPARYRYAHVIRIPTPASHQMAYGRALHAAVQAYHRRQMAGEPMSLQELHAELDANWESVGYLTQRHEEARRQAAREALARFWDEQRRDPARPVAVEQEFAAAIGRERVRGRYDRIDHDDDGRVVITDYKSSDVRDPATANRRARESLQLSIYALAYQAQHGRLPDEVTLHFLESGITGRVVPTAGRLDKAADAVVRVGEGIRAGRFQAAPSPMRCGFCPFREICPDAAR
ncbi:MAG TPA: ATP-dependent DNA helicase [Candidatus Limnocylindria bacterium]|nr:ATP-dependent DNA helicase [Candidatus Limnocylindria bacterium]